MTPPRSSWAARVTDGCWHGLLEGDVLCVAFLHETLGLAGWGACFPAARERRFDLLGDLVDRIS